MRGPDDITRRRWLSGCLTVVAGVVVAGCSAGPLPRPVPSPLASTPSVPIPDDGVSLAELGFSHGPVTAWSLPRGVALTDRIDQPNQLTMVVTNPAPEAVVTYLAEALPPAGFTVEHSATDGAASALIATGYGWRGSVIGADNGRTTITLQQV